MILLERARRPNDGGGSKEAARIPEDALHADERRLFSGIQRGDINTIYANILGRRGEGQDPEYGDSNLEIIGQWQRHGDATEEPRHK